MTSSGLIGLIIRHWLLVLTCAVLGALLAVAAAMFVVSPAYSATVKLYVSGAGATADDRLQNGEYARSHVASYADMIASNDVLGAVRGKLGLPQTGDAGYLDLADSITASNPLGTLIIDVTVQDTSPQQAQAVAAAVGQVYDGVVERLESPTGSKQSPVRISVVSAPALPIDRDSPSRKLYAIVGLVAGAAIGAGLALIPELWPRRSRRSTRIKAEFDPASWWPDPEAAQPPADATQPVDVLAAPNPGGHASHVARPAGEDERGAAGS